MGNGYLQTERLDLSWLVQREVLFVRDDEDG